ncbi:MAG: hypothetical protein QOF30_79 [Acidimicrobiaceae bacterium]|nr:hypothetical protein [Acidimicrobiaceae bacterium]
MSPVVRRHDTWTDILAEPVTRRSGAAAMYPEVPAARGVQVGHKGSGFRGAIARVERDGVVLRGATGLERIFRMTPGAFVIEGKAVTLVTPKGTPQCTPAMTASGSVAVIGSARVARASRILVEGVHDAALVERVWGDDLRVEGVVVERLDGLSHLGPFLADFAPGPNRRLGVLVDHLVAGTKEARLAAQVDHDDILVTGTPFVDVWQAVKPSVIGITRWPQVPRDIDWKTGVCQQLGVGDPLRMWRRILGSVRSYADLEPELVGAVEQLIDFVTA